MAYARLAGRIRQEVAFAEHLQLAGLGPQALGRGLPARRLALPPEHEHRDRDKGDGGHERRGRELPPAPLPSRAWRRRSQRCLRWPTDAPA